MLYRKEDYARSVFPSPEETQAIEAGKKYTLGADSYLWAEDAALVKRVREFLGKNFHWHDHLAKGGAGFGGRANTNGDGTRRECRRYS